MKANELMIGDWVCYKGRTQRPVRVVSFNNQTIKFDNGTPQDWLSSIEMFEPIPLTAEILEKNGLKMSPSGNGFLAANFDEDENFDLEISMDNNKIYWSVEWDEYHVIELRYVHQLQHALRLCGINKEIII